MISCWSAALSLAGYDAFMVFLTITCGVWTRYKSVGLKLICTLSWLVAQDHLSTHNTLLPVYCIRAAPHHGRIHLLILLYRKLLKCLSHITELTRHVS
jgi:hypothetical protein